MSSRDIKIDIKYIFDNIKMLSNIATENTYEGY